MQKLSNFIFLFVFLWVSSPAGAQETLTWQEALQKAAENHPNLVSATEQIRQSKDNSLIAGSALWPQVSANLAATRSKATSGSSKSEATNYSYGISGSQLIFDAFKTVHTVRSSKEDIKASAENFKFVSSQVRFRLRSAFINLLKAQKSLQLTQDIYNIRRENLELISLRYHSGMEHKGALLTAKANLAQAQLDINQAKRNMEVVQRSLSKEIGAKTFEPILVKGDFDHLTESYDQQPDFESLVKENPQLSRINAQINAASFDVKSDQNDFWPSVSLVGGASKSEDQWPPSNSSTDVGVRLTWSLLEGGSRLAQLDRSKSIVADLKAQRQSLKDELVLNLEQAWASLKDAIEQVSVSKSFMEAAIERSQIAEQQYSVGLITYDNWTIIQDDLVANKKTLLNTQANALLAEASWVSAQGRTLEYEKR